MTSLADWPTLSAKCSKAAEAHRLPWSYDFPRLAKLNPAPTRDIPLLIGGAGEKKSFVTRDSYPAKPAVLAEHCQGADATRPSSNGRPLSVARPERAGADGLIAEAER